MNIIESILLGIVQGLTEFLPVSSSAHLQIIPYLLGLKEHQLSYDVLMHLGTLLAVVIYFKNDLLNILKSLTTKNPVNNVNDKKLLLMLFIGTIPAAVAGVLLKDFFESMFSKILYIAIFLSITGVVLFMSEVIFAKKNNLKNISNMKIIDSFLIGCAQAVAILPGISRSGSTISCGLVMGLNKEDAARFSFLLAIPAILGAVVLQSKEILLALQTNFISSFIAFVTSFIFGYLAIAFFISFIKKNSLKIFSFYCFIISFITLLKYFLVKVM